MRNPENFGVGVHRDTKNGCYPICPPYAKGCGEKINDGDEVVRTDTGVFHRGCYEKAYE